MNNINVISHRGANKRAPQNTILAFRKSLEIGVDGFETDVHLTKDGVPVICHNYDVDDTSNGHGFISEMNFDELRHLDFGSYFSSVYAGTTLPSLDEFLMLSKNGGIKVMNIEIKEPKDGSLAIVSKVLDMVNEYDLFDELIISSFCPEILVECKRINPETKTGLLYSPNQNVFYKKLLFSFVEYAKELGVDYMHPHYAVVTQNYVEKLHENGIGVNPWTVDNESDIRRMIKFGVDGIITNIPDLVNDILSE